MDNCDFVIATDVKFTVAFRATAYYEFRPFSGDWRNEPLRSGEYVGDIVVLRRRGVLYNKHPYFRFSLNSMIRYVALCDAFGTIKNRRNENVVRRD